MPATRDSRSGTTARIALGDPDGRHATERGDHEGIGDAMPAKIRNALALCRSVAELEKR